MPRTKNKSDQPAPRRAARRFARQAADTSLDAEPSPKPRTPSRLDQIELLLLRAEGASIAELADATGWQKHSLRGAIAGAMRKRGLVITSLLREDGRTYFATRALP